MTRGKNSTPPGHVNLRMLAEHLELSQTTVSLVLNNSPSAKSIPEETRKRVIEAAERLNAALEAEAGGLVALASAPAAYRLQVLAKVFR